MGSCWGMCVDVKRYGGADAEDIYNNGSRSRAPDTVDEHGKDDLSCWVSELRQVLTQPQISCSAEVERIGSGAGSASRASYDIVRLQPRLLRS